MRIAFCTSISTDCFDLEDLECELSINRDHGAFDIDGITIRGRNPFEYAKSLDAHIAGLIIGNAEAELNTYGSGFSRRVEQAWAEYAEAA